MRGRWRPRSSWVCWVPGRVRPLSCSHLSPTSIKRPSPPLPASEFPQELLQLNVPISQMWGNRGPQTRQCLPTPCLAPNLVSSHLVLCSLLCVLRPAAHRLWAEVSPNALRMPRLVGLGCQGGSKKITGAQAGWDCEFLPSFSSVPGPGRASVLPQG